MMHRAPFCAQSVKIFLGWDTGRGILLPLRCLNANVGLLVHFS